MARTEFADREDQWRRRLGGLRDVVRQEMVSRQLGRHLPDPPLRVLDLGCGQGTQALHLARRGDLVTGLDPSPDLLALFGQALAAEPDQVRERVTLIEGDAERVAAFFPEAAFGAVLCHGVLMYLPDPAPVLQAIAGRLLPGAIASLLVRNGDALAMRPGQLGDWATARRAFGMTTYVNRIGVKARADRLDDLTSVLAGHGLTVRQWYGVRVFTDLSPDDATVPSGEELAALLDCEERAGRTDPYRRVASLTHVIAVRAG